MLTLEQTVFVYMLQYCDAYVGFVIRKQRSQNDRGGARPPPAGSLPRMASAGHQASTRQPQESHPEHPQKYHQSP